MRRRDQLLSIKQQIKRLRRDDPELDLLSLSFLEASRLLLGAGLLDPKQDEDRQVAMFLSYVRFHTTDEDARWSLFG